MRNVGGRALVIAVAIALLSLTACAMSRQNEETVERGQPATEPPSTTTGPSGSSSSGAVAAGGGSIDDGGAVGSAGQELLSPAVPAAVIEIDRSPNGQLTADARAVLAEELGEHGGKSSVRPGADSGVPAKDEYSAGDLRAIEAAARGSRSTANTAAIYVLVLEGRFEDPQVTGVAYGATSFAVFPEQISGGVLGLNIEAFEAAVLVHELGHLFGLVDLTGKGAFHEDPDHPGHSRNRGSVMYWAVEDVSIRNVFQGGPPRDFDSADIEEMSRIRPG